MLLSEGNGLMADTIIIRELEVWYCVGVPDEERAKPQRLLLTIEMSHDFSSAALSDDLAKTIDYYAVSQRLLHFGEGRSWKLIEKLAIDIAEMVLQDFRPKQVAVEVQKFIIPQTRCVCIRIVRRPA
jgi:FolB domain-containing protein